MEEYELTESAVVEILAASAIFDGLTPPELTALAPRCTGVRLAAGEVLMRQGEPADAAYVVQRGRVQATVATSDGLERVVGELGRGEVVGEIAVVVHDLRTATVRARRDTTLLRIPSDAFHDLIRVTPIRLVDVATMIVRRHREVLQRPPPDTRPATIALMGADADTLRELAAQLAHAMVPGMTRVVGSEAAAHIADGSLAAWLLDVEASTQLSLFLTDDGPTEWTRQCLRHADIVLLVATDDGPSGRTTIETDPECSEWLGRTPVHLVMWYRRRPRSSLWLRGRSVARHHNVRQGEAGEIERLARVLSGRSRCLVLGGGGARGFAHLGVLGALDEHGYAFDAVIGTSAGAVVAGARAITRDIEEMTGRILDWFARTRWRRDAAVPGSALLTGRQLAEGLQQFGGNVQIEDLLLDFAAVSTDLVSARPYVHTTGELWRAVRSSAAVPGIFPPVAGPGGQLLVDGGLVANLPVGLAAERHGGATIVAVDVGGLKGIRADGASYDGITARLARRNRDTVGLGKILLRLTELGRQNDQEDRIDILVRPELGGIGLLDTARAKEAIVAGRRAVEALVANGTLGDALGPSEKGSRRP